MIPPEIMRWADLPTIALVILASQVLRPVVSRADWFRRDPDRIIVLPLALGLIIGAAVELALGQQDPATMLRRVMVDGFGAAGMFRAGKIAARRGGGDGTASGAA